MSSIGITLWIIFVILILITLILVADFFHYLKAMHRAVWENLGSPHLLVNNSIQNNFAFLAYLAKGNYLLSNDEVLARKGSRLRLLYAMDLILVIITVIAFVTGRLSI
jgi:hypothetical protein